MPEEAVDQFYTMLDALGVRAVPDSLALEALRPFMADALVAAMADARQRLPGATSGDTAASPLGNPYSSLPEGYSEHRIRPAVTTGDSALVPLALANADQQPPVQWVDTVVVTRGRGRWVVADVRYGADWDFAARGTLRQALQLALQRKRPPVP